MKKWLLTILAAALIASGSIIPVLAKSSADFADLKDLDAATKAKFDAMINAGIFDGVSDTTFGLKDEMNRAQFAKVAALIFGLQVDANVKTSSFSDVKADDAANGYALPFIEAVKKAGITNGVGDGKFNPAGTVTKEQLATFFVRGLGVEDKVSSTPGLNDSTVSDWAKGYVALALELKLLQGNADGQFGGKTNATRDLLVMGAYEAKAVYETQASASPTPSATPTVSPSPTATPTATSTSTPVPTPAPTSPPVSTQTPTSTPVSTPTSTPVWTPTGTAVTTPTPTATETSSPMPSSTATDSPEPTTSPTSTSPSELEAETARVLNFMPESGYLTIAFHSDLNSEYASSNVVITEFIRSIQVISTDSTTTEISLTNQTGYYWDSASSEPVVGIHGLHSEQPFENGQTIRVIFKEMSNQAGGQLISDGSWIDFQVVINSTPPTDYPGTPGTYPPIPGTPPYEIP